MSQHVYLRLRLYMVRLRRQISREINISLSNNKMAAKNATRLLTKSLRLLASIPVRRRHRVLRIIGEKGHLKAALAITHRLLHRTWRGKPVRKRKVIGVFRTVGRLRRKLIATLKKNPPKAKSAALLIGIDYIGTSDHIPGCIKDAQAIKTMLIRHYDARANDILLLRDDRNNHLYPTKANILRGFNWLVKKSQAGYTRLFFHYSGHGSWRPDKSGDEADGRDELLVPVDANSVGMLSDDTIYTYLLERLRPNVRLVCFMDCCHSGTILDLPLRYRNRGGHDGAKDAIMDVERIHAQQKASEKIRAHVVAISGCRDKQVSEGAQFTGLGWRGAMTLYLISILKNAKYKITFSRLLYLLRRKLRNNRFKQVPELTSNRRITNKTLFSTKGVI